MQVPGNLEKNGGNIYMAKASPPGICEAYFDQYTSDFSTFLRLRSLEIAPKGCMVLTFQGRSSADPSNSGCCILYEILAKSLQDMSTKVHMTSKTGNLMVLKHDVSLLSVFIWNSWYLIVLIIFSTIHRFRDLSEKQISIRLTFHSITPPPMK